MSRALLTCRYVLKMCFAHLVISSLIPILWEGKKKQNISVRTWKQKAADSRDWVSTYIEVLQLCFGWGLLHKLQNRAQITNIDASLVQGLRQGGSIHG